MKITEFSYILFFFFKLLSNIVYIYIQENVKYIYMYKFKNRFKEYLYSLIWISF